MKVRLARMCASAGALALAIGLTAPANALTINLIDSGGVTGSQSELGFKAAKSFWESVITTNVTVNFSVGYSALAPGVIGSTTSNRLDVALEDVIDQLDAGRTSALDNAAILPTLGTGTYSDPTFGPIHGVNMVRNGTVSSPSGINVNTFQYDTSVTRNNARLNVNTANLKALGYVLPAGNDATISFSSAFAFDFNPLDGIDSGQMDFVGVAIHEMGHALGFTSGVDFLDQYAGAGPGASVGNGFNWNGQTMGTVLDLFRYSSDPHNVAPGTTPVLDWSIGTASYFSINGGASQLFGSALMSTGQYNGDGKQASHFKDASGGGACDGYSQIGIMDPTFCYGEMGVVKAQDLAAMDAIGWTLNLDILNNASYTETTKQWYTSYAGPSQHVTPEPNAVPEPTSWALFITGFGLIGSVARRRRQAAAAA